MLFLKLYIFIRFHIIMTKEHSAPRLARIYIRGLWKTISITAIACWWFGALPPRTIETTLLDGRNIAIRTLTETKYRIERWLNN